MNPNNFIPPFTPEWNLARIGCYTSSEIIRLLKGGKRSMSDAELKARAKGDTRKTIDILFGDGAIKYINEKVAEIINKRPKYVPVTKPMQWGLSMESFALEIYEKVTGRKMEPCGFYKYNSYSGGSPDAIFGKRKIIGVAEVKCLNSENHSEICELETAEQLREYDEQYFAQCQMNCMVTGAKWADFISFCPRAMGYDDNGEVDELNYDEDKFIFCIKIIRVKRDEAYIKNIEMRLDAAAGIMVDKLNKRMKAAEKNLKWYLRTQKKSA